VEEKFERTGEKLQEMMLHHGFLGHGPSNETENRRLILAFGDQN
jgi:hypothetical protein